MSFNDKRESRLPQEPQTGSANSGTGVGCALTSAVAAMLIVGGSLGFLHYRNVQGWREGEAAKQQALVALRITNAKLNHVIERVKTSQAP